MKKENIFIIAMILLLIIGGILFFAYHPAVNKKQKKAEDQSVDNKGVYSFSEKDIRFENDNKTVNKSPLAEVNNVQSGASKTLSANNTTTQNNNTQKTNFDLPEKYISGQGMWPPKIYSSSAGYRCDTRKIDGDAPTVIVEKKINNQIFCISSQFEDVAGGQYGTFRYTTDSKNGSRYVSFALRFSDCDNFLGLSYMDCRESIKNFDLNQAIASLDW